MPRPSIISALAAAALAACLAIPPSLADERLETMHEDTLQTILSLRQEVALLVTPETHFPEEFIAPWTRALDQAFDPELVERDLREAYQRHLTEDAITATLAFDASPLGQDFYNALDEVVVAAAAPDDGYWAGVAEFIDNAPTEVAAPYVDIFSLQLGPQRAEVTMEGMYRMMAAAASAVGGTEFGQQWIETARADGYTEGFAQELFIMSVAALQRLPEAQVREIAEIVAEPGMIAYAEQSHRAFEESYTAAIDRLEEALANELGTL